MTTEQQHPDEGTPGSNGGGNGAIIQLELSKVTRRIMPECFYNFRSKSVLARLNGKYQNKWIDSPIDVDDWAYTYEVWVNNLERSGVAADDLAILVNILNLNDNYNRIMDHHRQQTLEQMSIGQRNRKERIERQKKSFPKQVSVKQALKIPEGNVRVKGMFAGGSVKVENMYLRVGDRCGDCDETTISEDYSDRPRLASEIPKNLRWSCKNGCETLSRSPYAEFISARRVELHDTEASGDPPSIDVILFNDYALDTEYTEQVIVTGSIQHMKVKDKQLSHIFVGLNEGPIEVIGPDGPVAFDPVEYMDKRESVEVTSADMKKIQEFATKHKGRELEELVKLVAPGHIGDDDAKIGGLICAANTGIDSVRRKRRINMCFLGETGNDKSGLAREIIRLVPGSKFASAADSTTNSLICVVDPETGHYRYGPILTSNGAMCVVDEIGLMPKEEQRRLQSTMQEGSVNLGRYGFTRNLEASSSVILTSNPDSISGKFRQKDKIDTNEFPFLGTFRDRIDLIFIFRTNRTREHLQKYTQSKTKNMNDYSKLLKEEGENYQYLVKHILYAKTFDPQFSEEAELMINQYFENVMEPDNSEASNRLLETLRNICYGIARLKLKNIIEIEDAMEVIKFYDKQLKNWSQIPFDIPSDPRDLAYREIVKKLTGEKSGIEFVQLLHEVCKDNVSVSQYIGFDNKGKCDWNIGTNKKVRYIHEMFTRKLKDERVLIINLHPLMLAWRETYTGSLFSGGVVEEVGRGGEEKGVIDPVDPVDLEKSQSENNSPSDGNIKQEWENSVQNFNGDETLEVNKVNKVNKSPPPQKSPPPPESTSTTLKTSDAFRVFMLRQEEGKSLLQIAKVIGVSNQTVDRILKGERHPYAYIFFELVSKNAEANPSMERGALEQEYREALKSNGYGDDEINVIIKDIEDDKVIDPVYTEVDGELYRILRIKTSKQ
jgi:DNA replicative helicase MCM subunit Mcm2 (Cdc46/Mcm family)/transcriptional regulator with XRE-family HTH domain